MTGRRGMSDLVARSGGDKSVEKYWFVQTAGCGSDVDLRPGIHKRGNVWLGCFQVDKNAPDEWEVVTRRELDGSRKVAACGNRCLIESRQQPVFHAFIGESFFNTLGSQRTCFRGFVAVQQNQGHAQRTVAAPVQVQTSDDGSSVFDWKLDDIIGTSEQVLQVGPVARC